MSECRAHLTVFGGRLLIRRVVEQGWSAAHAAKAQGCRVSVRTAGSPGGGQRARPTWSTGRRGHIRVLAAPALTWRLESRASDLALASKASWASSRSGPSLRGSQGQAVRAVHPQLLGSHRRCSSGVAAKASLGSESPDRSRRTRGRSACPLAVIDLADGWTDLPPTDGLLFEGVTVRAAVRPSGTEPKLKCYLQVKQSPEGDLTSARSRAMAAIAAAKADLAEALGL